MSRPNRSRSRVNIFHPSDFSRGSQVAFSHALKIAILAKAQLEIMHVATNEKDMHWTEFPGVRSTLARWGILPEGVNREEVIKIGVAVRKVLARGRNPVDSILRHLEHNPVNMIVLATHQREGLARWFHHAVAEPVARGSRTMTLFFPRKGKGFISPVTGRIRLKRILIPFDRLPSPQLAIRKAAALARGLGCKDASFTLLHVGRAKDTPEVQMMGSWAWEKIVRNGDVLEEIHKAEIECDADLIVLATEGHQGFLDALRGSTTERVVREATCPVLAVPVK